MIFDTDILIWVERGNQKAAHFINAAGERYLSILTFMELLQGARTQKEIQRIKDFVSSLNFQLLPLTENIGHRASIYIEEYTVSRGIQVGDALIAATAIEHNLVLATGNQKHFKAIRDLKLKLFIL